MPRRAAPCSDEGAPTEVIRRKPEAYIAPVTLGLLTSIAGCEATAEGASHSTYDSACAEDTAPESGFSEGDRSPYANPDKNGRREGLLPRVPGGPVRIHQVLWTGDVAAGVREPPRWVAESGFLRGAPSPQANPDSCGAASPKAPATWLP